MKRKKLQDWGEVTAEQISAVMRALRYRAKPENMVRTREQCQRAAAMSAQARRMKRVQDIYKTT